MTYRALFAAWLLGFCGYSALACVGPREVPTSAPVSVDDTAARERAIDAYIDTKIATPLRKKGKHRPRRTVD